MRHVGGGGGRSERSAKQVVESAARLNWLLVMSENLLVSAAAREVSQWVTAAVVVETDGWVGGWLGRKEQKVKTQRGVSRKARKG